MGQGKEIVSNCFKANALVCKVISVILIVFSIGITITGIVLVVEYLNNNFSYDDDLDDWYEQSQKRGTGIGCLAIGLLLLLCSMLTTCCAFQFGVAKQCAQSTNDMDQQQTIVEQPLPQEQPSCPEPAAYPPQAYPAPLPPLPASYGPSNGSIAMPPPVLPSYEQASHMATAPMPISAPPYKQ